MLHTEILWSAARKFFACEGIHKQNIPATRKNSELGLLEFLLLWFCLISCSCLCSGNLGLVRNFDDDHSGMIQSSGVVLPVYISSQKRMVESDKRTHTIKTLNCNF